MSRAIIGGLLVASTLAVMAMPARAQTPAPGTAPQPTIEDLQHSLADRDAVINDLERRVQALEQQKGAAAPAGTPNPSQTATPAPPPQNPSAQGQPTQPPANQGGPGQFAVDQLAAEHALERVLVEQGALLVPKGSVEIEPVFTYARNEMSFASVFGSSVASSQVRQNNYIGEMDIRAGLPWDSQVELDLPYRYIDQRTVTSVGLTGVSGVNANGGGFGDTTATLSKTVLREGVWNPDLVAAVQYSQDFGGAVDGFPYGIGYNQARGILTATKRADPLAFVGSFAFAHGFDEHGFHPGNEYDVSFGTVLASSPETSLRFLLQQSFFDTGNIGTSPVFRSGETISTFVAGASVLLTPKILLDVSIGIGLTSDAPKYYFRVGLPIRFDQLWGS